MYIINATLTKDTALLWTGLRLAIIEGFVVSIIFIIAQTIFWKPTIKFVADIKSMMFQKGLRLPMAYYDNNHSGNILSRLTNDVNVFYNLYSFTLYRILVLLLSGISSVAVMFVLDWRFGLVLMASALLSLWINSLLVGRSRIISDQLQKSLGSMTEKMSDSLSDFAVVRLFGLDKIMQEKFTVNNEEIQRLAYKRSKQTAILSSVNFIISWSTMWALSRWVLIYPFPTTSTWASCWRRSRC